MVEITKAPSGVQFVVAFLKAQYLIYGETASVGSKVRDPRPPKFTKVRQLGLRRELSRAAPMLVFECWGNDDLAAENLGILTESLINSLPDLDGRCTRVVEVGGLYSQDDPISGSPRWIFTKQIYLPLQITVAV